MDYGKTHIDLTGDVGSIPVGIYADDHMMQISELSLGIEWSRSLERGGKVTVAALWEAQAWEWAPVVGLIHQDIGLTGPTFSFSYMRRRANQHVTSRATKPASGLQRYDRCRVAVFLAPLLRGEPLIGTAHFQRDDLPGNILRISLEGDSPGRPEIIVAENEGQGLITPGRAYGCDYCLSSIPEPVSVASASDLADLSATVAGNVTLTITDSFVHPPPNSAHSSYSGFGVVGLVTGGRRGKRTA